MLKKIYLFGAALGCQTSDVKRETEEVKRQKAKVRRALPPDAKYKLHRSWEAVELPTYLVPLHRYVRVIGCSKD